MSQKTWPNLVFSKLSGVSNILNWFLIYCRGFEGDLQSQRRQDAFGSLRPGGGLHLDGYGTGRMPPQQAMKGNNGGGVGLGNLPINDGYGTARSVKKVYLWSSWATTVTTEEDDDGDDEGEDEDEIDLRWKITGFRYYHRHLHIYMLLKILEILSKRVS